MTPLQGAFGRNFEYTDCPTSVCSSRLGLAATLWPAAVVASQPLYDCRLSGMLSTPFRRGFGAAAETQSRWADRRLKRRPYRFTIRPVVFECRPLRSDLPRASVFSFLEIPLGGFLGCSWSVYAVTAKMDSKKFLGVILFPCSFQRTPCQPRACISRPQWSAT